MESFATASTSAHLRYHYQMFIIRFGQWETFFNNGQKLKLLVSDKISNKILDWIYIFTINICLLDLKTISLAPLHSLLSSTWNGTNSERICSIMEMTLNYAYVIKTVIFVLYIIVVLIPNHWRLVKTFLNHKRGGSEWGAQRWSSAMCTVSQKPHICSKHFRS